MAQRLDNNTPDNTADLFMDIPFIHYINNRTINLNEIKHDGRRQDLVFLETTAALPLCGRSKVRLHEWMHWKSMPTCTLAYYSI